MRDVVIFFGWFIIFLVVMFVAWRRVKDEYTEDEAITLVFKILLGSLTLGSLLGWLSDWAGLPYQIPWAWGLKLHLYGVLAGGYGALLVSLKKKSWAWGDILDGFLEAVLWGGWLASWIMNIVHIWSLDVRVLTDWGLWTLGLGLFYWGRHNYRKFHWFESGKVGFVFWFGTMMIAGVHLVQSFVLLSGWRLGVAVLLDLLMAGFAFLGLYRLSGRNWRKDVAFFQNMGGFLNKKKHTE